MSRERIQSFQMEQAVSATFDAWKEMERVDIATELASGQNIIARTYGKENPNIRRDVPTGATPSRRGFRNLLIREVVEDVGSLVKIGNVNRIRR